MSRGLLLNFGDLQAAWEGRLGHLTGPFEDWEPRGLCENLYWVWQDDSRHKHKISPSSGQLPGWNLSHRVVIVSFPDELAYPAVNCTNSKKRCYSSVFPQYLVQCWAHRIFIIRFSLVNELRHPWLALRVYVIQNPFSLKAIQIFQKPYLLLSVYLQNEDNVSIISWHESFRLMYFKRTHLPKHELWLGGSASWVVIS